MERTDPEKAYGEAGTIKGPYRAHPDHYFETLGVRFNQWTIRRHREAIMRGIVNRDLRGSM